MAFKDLFIKADEQQPAATQMPNKPVGGMSIVPNIAPPPPSAIVAPATEQNATVNATVNSEVNPDDGIINKIWDKIIEKNRPGPDYLELKNNVEALEDLPITNEQKLMSAFKVLKKGYPNFQKDDITKAIDYYISVVNDEKELGLKELESLRARNIIGTEREIEEMKSKAETLKRQYDELQANIGAKTLELAQAKSDIDTKYNAFVGSVDAVLKVLQMDKENIVSLNF